MCAVRLAWLALLLAACSTPPNSQRLPIGSRCNSDGDCGTAPFNCVIADPGGYCSRPCITNGDCPADALCIGSACRRTCVDASACRTNEGYVCRSEPGTNSPVCDTTAGTPLDGGAPSG
jgi:hypothetical protein